MELKSCSNASVGLISVKIVVCLSVCFLTKASHWFSPFEVDKRLGSLTEKWLPYCNGNGV